eukprot:2520326-Amphidinium_carterae.1
MGDPLLHSVRGSKTWSQGGARWLSAVGVQLEDILVATPNARFQQAYGRRAGLCIGGMGALIGCGIAFVTLRFVEDSLDCLTKVTQHKRISHQAFDMNMFIIAKEATELGHLGLVLTELQDMRD